MIEDSASAAVGPFVSLGNAFTPREVDEIIALGDRLALGMATVGVDKQQNSALRITRMAAFTRTPETEFIYRKMEMLVRQINAHVYQFDLAGFSEPFQFTVYQGEEGGHYGWHVDQGVVQANRKLSLSLQLTDSAEYEGCDLELFATSDVTKAPRERGTLIAFPSYALHRVTPVTRGTRRSLVIWMAGPRFR